MALPTYGTMGVDWEERVNFDPLRRGRPAPPPSALRPGARRPPARGHLAPAWRHDARDGTSRGPGAEDQAGAGGAGAPPGAARRGRNRAADPGGAAEGRDPRRGRPAAHADGAADQ